MKKFFLYIIVLIAVYTYLTEAKVKAEDKEKWGKSPFQARKKKEEKAKDRFSLQGIFYSDKFKIAVISGYIVKEGDVFEGTRVLAITPSRVKIRGQNRVRWLALKDILEASKEETKEKKKETTEEMEEDE